MKVLIIVFLFVINLTAQVTVNSYPYFNSLDTNPDPAIYRMTPSNGVFAEFRPSNSWDGSGYIAMNLPSGNSGGNGQYAGYQLQIPPASVLVLGFDVQFGPRVGELGTPGGTYRLKYVDAYSGGREQLLAFIKPAAKTDCYTIATGLDNPTYYMRDGTPMHNQSGLDTTTLPFLWIGTGTQGPHDNGGKWIRINYVFDTIQDSVHTYIWSRDGRFNGHYMSWPNSISPITYINFAVAYCNPHWPGGTISTTYHYIDNIYLNDNATLDVPPASFFVVGMPPGQTDGVDIEKVPGPWQKDSAIIVR